jgi:hypothetical protein
VPDWTDPAWLDEAQEWIHARLRARGTTVVPPIEQLHVRPWSTVMRVPTDGGVVFFKANARELVHEAALVSLLAANRPDCVPTLLAADLERGWMLTADAGSALREIVGRDRDLTPWLEVLPLYAGLQRDIAPHADDLVSLGVPDLRLATLGPRFVRFLDTVDVPEDERRRLSAAAPRVQEMCDELAAVGVPETIQHDDLHDGQVFVTDGRYVFGDWGDACVSHPFFTLSVTLEGVLAWGFDDVRNSVDVGPFRDAYLTRYADDFERVELEPAVDVALRLGWICRAVNGGAGERDSGPTRTRLRMFLDGHP